jgi:hypothetical protein
VSEQDGQPVRPAVLDDVQVTVADAARLDPDPDLVRPRRIDLDLLDAEPADLGQNDAAVHADSRSLISPDSSTLRSAS